MQTEVLQHFVEGTRQYFAKVTKQDVKIGVPSLLGGDEVFLADITGAIGVAGAIQGAIYITGKKSAFAALLKAYNPHSSGDDDDVLDAAGEIANIIAGNAQKHFSKGFEISVPMIFTGDNGQIRMKEPRYNIPIDWNEHRMHLVVGLNKE